MEEVEKLKTVFDEDLLKIVMAMCLKLESQSPLSQRHLLILGNCSFFEKEVISIRYVGHHHSVFNGQISLI